jgi:ATP synthase protein I
LLKKKKPSLSKQVTKYVSVGTIGLHLISGIIVGIFIGYMLDHLFKTDYIFTIIFFFFGIAAGFYNMYKDAMRYLKEEEKKNEEENNKGV